MSDTIEPAVKTIALRQAATLLYLKRRGTGVVPELTTFLARLGLKSSANYMALLLRGLEAQGWVELIGQRRRTRYGFKANEWRLTPDGEREASAVERCFHELLTPHGEPTEGSGSRPGRKGWWARPGRNRALRQSRRAGRSRPE